MKIEQGKYYYRLGGEVVRVVEVNPSKKQYGCPEVVCEFWNADDFDVKFDANPKIRNWHEPAGNLYEEATEEEYEMQRQRVLNRYRIYAQHRLMELEKED